MDMIILLRVQVCLATEVSLMIFYFFIFFYFIEVGGGGETFENGGLRFP